MNRKRSTRARICSNGINFAKCKRSQVTIFIIVAILIVAVLLIFFMLRGKIAIPGVKTSLPNVQSEIESCVKDSVTQAVDIILPQGGYINPTNYKLYRDNKIAYLCYNIGYYKPCINQDPGYLTSIKKQILDYVSPKIEDCFYKLQQDYQDKGYAADFSPTQLDLTLAPKKVDVTINKKIEISKGNSVKKIDEIKVGVSSPIYNLANIAKEITNQEARFCYFEYLGYMLLYPDYKIGKIDINGDTKIYNIEDKLTGKTLNIAIRSCAMPAGL